MQKYLISTTVLTADETWTPMKQPGLTDAVNGTLEIQIEAYGDLLKLLCTFKLIQHGEEFEVATECMGQWHYSEGSYALYVKFETDDIQKQLKEVGLGVEPDEIISFAQEEGDFLSIIYAYAKTAHVLDDQLGDTNCFYHYQLDKPPLTFLKGYDHERLMSETKYMDAVRLQDFLNYVECEKVSLDETFKINLYTFPDGSSLISSEAKRYFPEEYFNKNLTKFKRGHTAFKKGKADECKMRFPRNAVVNLLEAASYELILECIKCSPPSVEVMSNEIEDHLAKSGIQILTPKTRDQFNLALNGGRRTVRFEGDRECW